MRMQEAMAALSGSTANVLDTRSIVRSPDLGGSGGTPASQDRQERSVSLG